MIFLLSALSALAEDDSTSWYALPVIDYTSDTGLGLGASGGLYFERAGFAPYKSAIELDLYATTRRIQEHSLWFEVLRLADTPVRLQGSLGFVASVSDNFCGIAGDPDCQTAAELSEAGLQDTHQLLRYSAPTASLAALYRPAAWPVGVMGGLYGARYRPGVFDVTTPYPDSLYASTHPEGETGWFSTAMIGLLRDTRDNEIATVRGVLAEVSVRGGGAATGSQWTSAGLSAAGSGFFSPHPTLTSATRLVFDQVWGAVPTMELSTFSGWIGGSGLGGDIGRGIRAGRYIGRSKLLGQQELRYMPIRITRFASPVGIGVVGFFDAGAVADAGQQAAAWGTGGGLRIDVAEFVVRYDLGVSPVEDWQPYSYIDFGHAF